MHVSVEITSELGRRLTIGIPAERVEGEVLARLEKAAKTVRIKGFRPGKVPMKVIRQRFGTGVRQEVIGEMMNRSFYEAVRQEDLRPAGVPSIEPRQLDDGRDVEFIATFEIYPEIELVDFGKLEIERPVAEVNEADVDRMIEVLRTQQANWVEAERAAATGDQVNIDFRGRQGEEEVQGMSGSGTELVLGSGRMIPGFEDAIVGMGVGESREVPLVFPEDYRVEELRGAQAEFTITLNGVKQRELPELDDAFFRIYGVQEGGMEKFRAEVRANMERELRQAVRNKLKGRVLDALAAKTEVSVPRSLVDQEISGLRQQMMRQFGAEASRIDENMLPDDMFRANAERRVTLGLLLGEVIRCEKLSADAARVRAAVTELASTYEDPEEVVNWYYGNREQLSTIEAMVLEDQVIDVILERADVKDCTMNYEEALRPDATAAQQAAGA